MECAEILANAIKRAFHEALVVFCTFDKLAHDQRTINPPQGSVPSGRTMTLKICG